MKLILNLKRISAALICAIIVSVMPSVVFAKPSTEGAAMIGGTAYATLADAIAHAKDGDVITPADSKTIIKTKTEAALAANTVVKGFRFGDGGCLKITGGKDFSLLDCSFEA